MPESKARRPWTKSFALLSLAVAWGGCAATPREEEPAPFARMRADQLLRSRKFDTAIERYLACLGRTGGDLQEEAAIHLHLSQAYWGRQGRIGDREANAETRTADRAAAVASAETALALLKSVPRQNRRTGTGPAGRTLAAYLRDEDKLDEAVALYAQLLESEIEPDEERVRLLFESGNTHFTRSRGSASPMEEPNRSATDLLTAQKRLEEAIELAHRLEKCPPFLLASIEHSLGLVFEEQLQYALAVERFTNAEELCRIHEIHDSHAEVLQNLTLALIENGRYEEARERCKQLEQMLDASIEPRTMTALGIVYLKLGRPKDALTKFDLARSQCLQEERCRQESGFLAELACNTASACQEMGAYDEAEQALRNAQKELGEDGNPRIQAVVQANLARVYLTLERLDAAQTQLEEVKELFERLSGPRHPDTLLVELDLASLARARGHLIEARKRYEEAIRALIGRLGKEHLQVAAARMDLAALYQDQGLCQEALDQARQAQHSFESMLGVDQPRVVIAFLRMVLIDVECNAAKLEDATIANLLNEAGRRFKRLRDTMPTDSVEVLRATVCFADMTARTPTAVATALERYHEAEEGFLHLYGSGALSVAALRLKQARLLQRMGRHDEAAQTCDRALRLMDRSLEQHPIRAELLAALGDSLAATGANERAATLWREAVQILMTTYGSDHPRVQQFKAERAPKAQEELDGKAP